MPDDSGVTVVTMLVCFLFFACEAAGASRARHSLRPHLCWAGKFMHHSGVEPSRECGGVRGLSGVVVDCQTSSLRGANATKQSSFLIRAKMDCFASARNGGMGDAVGPHRRSYPSFLWDRNERSIFFLIPPHASRGREKKVRSWGWQFAVMPGLVPGIHVLSRMEGKNVDGPDVARSSLRAPRP